MREKERTKNQEQRDRQRKRERETKKETETNIARDKKKIVSDPDSSPPISPSKPESLAISAAECRTILQEKDIYVKIERERERDTYRDRETNKCK